MDCYTHCDNPQYIGSYSPPESSTNGGFEQCSINVKPGFINPYMFRLLIIGGLPLKYQMNSLFEVLTIGGVACIKKKQMNSQPLGSTPPHKPWSLATVRGGFAHVLKGEV